ncbi:MAG TPA: hypothetical protein VGN23_12900 [Verrucomicrobiae bacterium]|jgi:hypothetical protein
MKKCRVLDIYSGVGVRFRQGFAGQGSLPHHLGGICRACIPKMRKRSQIDFKHKRLINSNLSHIFAQNELQKRSQIEPKGNIQYATSNNQRMVKPQRPFLLGFEVSLDLGCWSVGVYSFPSVFIRVHPWFHSVLSVSSCSTELTPIEAN